MYIPHLSLCLDMSRVFSPRRKERNLYEQKNSNYIIHIVNNQRGAYQNSLLTKHRLENNMFIKQPKFSQANFIRKTKQKKEKKFSLQAVFAFFYNDSHCADYFL